MPMQHGIICKSKIAIRQTDYTVRPEKRTASLERTVYSVPISHSIQEDDKLITSTSL